MNNFNIKAISKSLRPPLYKGQTINTHPGGGLGFYCVYIIMIVTYHHW